MRKKVVVFVVLLSSLFILKGNKVFGTEKEHIDSYVGDIMWKWYGTDWSTGALPKVTVDSNLVEGVDYERSWAITRNLVGNVSELTYYDEEEAKQIPQLPGSICEKVTGLGNYISEKVVCHVIYGYTYIRANNVTKQEGESDPEFTYTFSNYKNLNEDLSNYFNVTFEREEGEDIGEYTITPKFELKDESVIALSFVNSESLGSIQYLFKNLGRIIVQPVKGKLTIVEKNKEDEGKPTDEEEVIEEVLDTPKEEIIAPHTDIDFIY